MAGGSELLKQGLARSVRVERRGDGSVVVKRFEHPSALGRAFDGARARREYALLRHLSALGLDVPRPLGIVRRGRGHEVELQWIDGARTLADLLKTGPKLSTRLARHLGRLLAGLHSSGVDHPDLHAGNVLVTEGERAIAVDFDKARLVRALGQTQVERDLVSLCAGVREATRPAWRAIAFDSWWTALEPGLRASLARPEAPWIETLARTRRREVVEARARRWTRTGSAVVAIAGSGGFARAGAQALEIERALRGEDPPSDHVCVAGSRRRVLELWRSMARLEEHGIAAPRCKILITRSSARAWFALDPARAPASSADRGRFLGGLIDRGLWCESLEPGDLDRAGLIRPRQLVTADPSAAKQRLAPWLAGLDSRERQEFLGALRAAWQGSAPERSALSADLEHA